MPPLPPLELGAGLALVAGARRANPWLSAASRNLIELSVGAFEPVAAHRCMQGVSLHLCAT
jgi:hypothetical protein